MKQPDLSEFEALTKQRGTAITRLFECDKLDDAEKDQLRAALAAPNHTVSAKAIRAWLKARGVEIHVNSISGHRSRCV